MILLIGRCKKNFMLVLTIPNSVEAWMNFSLTIEMFVCFFYREFS
jgi:hypothetical protein